MVAPYRIEGLAPQRDDDGDIDIFAYGTRAECDAVFDKLKSVLIGLGNSVREVGCCVSKTQVPRHMLVNYPPYEVWKAIYRNLNVQDDGEGSG